MLTSRFFQLTYVTPLIICLALVTTLQAQETQKADAKEAVKYEAKTPKAAYDQFSKSWHAGEYKQMFATLSPRGESYVMASFMQIVGMSIGFAQANDPYVKPLEALLAKRGIKDLRATMNEVRDKLEKQGVDRKGLHMKWLIEMGKLLGEPVSFVDEMMKIYKKDIGNKTERRRPDGGGFAGFYGKIRDIRITGDKAEGWFRQGGMSGELNVEFIKKEGNWYIDMIYPSPQLGKGGNKHREVE